VNGLFNREELRLVSIPLPTLDIQRRIVAEVEAERTLVDSNRKLIEVFEAKIKAKLDEIWGAGEDTGKENDVQDGQEGLQDIGDSML
jgi:restriction endonuclease S subunit